LTERWSKSRQQAESAFSKTQSQSLARDRVISEEDAAVRARDEKTMRLRELRMAREGGDSAAPPIATPKRTP
jgi:hypothetical protein